MKEETQKGKAGEGQGQGKCSQSNGKQDSEQVYRNPCSDKGGEKLGGLPEVNLAPQRTCTPGVGGAVYLFWYSGYNPGTTWLHHQPF